MQVYGIQQPGWNGIFSFLGSKLRIYWLFHVNGKKTGAWSLVEKQVRSSERSSNLGLKANFPKTQGSQAYFKSGDSIHLWQGKFNILSIWSYGGDGSRQQQLSCTLKSYVPLSECITHFSPAQYLRSHFETDICSAIWEPQTEDRNSFSFTYSAEAREDWLRGSVPSWLGLQLIWEEQSWMTLRHYPNSLVLPNESQKPARRILWNP